MSRRRTLELNRGSSTAMATALTALMLALLTAPDATAAKRITGKLSKRGYDVIALAANGRTNSARARPRFKLRAPAKSITLHLRSRDGTYAGPVVVAGRRKGKRVILGVKAGAKLANVIRVNRRRGYAKAKLRKRWRDATIWARARRGVPRANGINFGRVRTKPRRGAVPGDLDLDGVPSRLDVDDDGDLVLDPVDRSRRSRGSRNRVRAGDGAAGAAGVGEDEPGFHVATIFPPPFAAGVNANATALTDADLDAALSEFGYLILGILPGDPELDCGGEPDPADVNGWIGGLVYCTRGGTGEAFAGGSFPGGPFPECCDPDGSGLGTPPNNQSEFPRPGFFFFHHRATTSQIGTGDVLIQRTTRDGTTTEATVLLPFVFGTAPALVSYDDGAGNSETIDYPISSGMGEFGGNENPFPVKARPNGDVMVTLTLWRPQRRPIGAERGDWIDIGGLGYSAKTHFTAAPSCPQDAFTESDPNLAPASFPILDGPAGLMDLAPDRPANPANTLTFTLNLTRCRAAHRESLEPGDKVGVSLHAVTSGTRGQADLNMNFERQE